MPLSFLVASAVGALLGDVIIHILPEIFAEASTLPISLTILGGMVVFFILEKILHWHHHHVVADCPHPTHQPPRPIGTLNVIADGLHNLIDGLIIGLAYLVSPAVGVATTVAVILHEIPQEIGDFAVLLHAGFTRRRAIMANLLSALVAVVGVGLAMLIGNQAVTLTPYILGLAGGGFLYIAGADLVPELHKETAVKKTAWQLLAMLLGIAMMLALTVFE